MHWKPSGRAFLRRPVAMAALVVTLGSLLIAGPDLAGARPTPPPNPTNGQLDAARNAKAALAAKIGALSGDIAAAKIQLQRSQNHAEFAEQQYSHAETKLENALVAATRAKREVQVARQQVDDAHARFVQYVQATYMTGDIEGTTGSLLTANDPSALLEQSALEAYQQQHQADAIHGLEQATVAKSNADAKRRQAVETATSLKAEAAKQLADARAAAVAAAQLKAALDATMAAKQHELDAAQEKLAALNHERAKYLAYRAEQARLARIRAERARRAREAAARRARRLANQANQGSHGGSSGPSAPLGGSWNAQKGQRAANRARSQVGWPYAWGGGGVGGPSRGFCVPSAGAPNDCNVVGYDCSGLAMYAWGRNWDHYAATQYWQAGRYHPSLSNLMPGDLLFWSDGGAALIHHVAVYIGNQQIVQAPNSGSYVMVSSMWDPGPIFGATRPLT